MIRRLILRWASRYLPPAPIPTPEWTTQQLYQLASSYWYQCQVAMPNEGHPGIEGRAGNAPPAPSWWAEAMYLDATIRTLSEVRNRLLVRGDFNHRQPEFVGDRFACRLAPDGWGCTRKAGHPGPCAAVRVTPVPHVRCNNTKCGAPWSEANKSHVCDACGHIQSVSLVRRGTPDNDGIRRGTNADMDLT